MAVSGTELTRVGASLSGVGKRLSISAKSANVATIVTLFKVNGVRTFSRPTVTTETGTTHTLDANDENSIVLYTNASAVSVTFPTGMVVGYIVHLHQDGAGQVTLSGAGITFKAAIGLKTRAQYSSLSAIVTDTNVVKVIGDAAA